jgi:hypothetical protein
VEGERKRKITKADRTGGVAQMVEHLPSKPKALSSTSILPPTTTTKEE